MTMICNPFRALMAALLAVAFVAAPAARGADEKKKSGDSELGKAMEDMGKAIKAIKKNVKDPAKNEETLKLVAKCQQDALTSKGLPPAMLAKTAEADKAKTLAGYRKMMADTIVALCKLENQLIDGKNEEAAETLKALKVLEDDGHEKYNP
jgi:Sec-independent protein translocase protein TatA